MSSAYDLIELAPLPPETWGQRIRRARGKHSLEEVAAAVSTAWPTSQPTLSRLEALEAPPTGRKARALAVLCLLLYGVDPAEFGLSLDDVPAMVDIKRFFDLRFLGLAWNGIFAPIAVLAS